MDSNGVFGGICIIKLCINDQGGTLSQAAQAYRFSEQHVAYVARESLKGLQYLHEKKWAHRDLKSHNIMMSIEGDIKLSTQESSTCSSI